MHRRHTVRIARPEPITAYPIPFLECGLGKTERLQITLTIAVLVGARLRHPVLCAVRGDAGPRAGLEALELRTVLLVRTETAFGGCLILQRRVP